MATPINQEAAPLIPKLKEERYKEGHVSLSWRQYLLEFSFFVYFLAYTLGDTISYQYMYKYASEELDFNSNNLTSNDSLCEVNKTSSSYQLQQRVGSMASTWQLYFALASGIPALFTGVIYGTYTDKLGRRFLMLVSTGSVCCRVACYVVAVQWRLQLRYVVIGYVLEGLGGSFTTMLLACFAYTADVTDTGKGRSIRMLVIFTISGMSDCVGYLVSGYSITNLGYRNAFLVVLGIFAVAILSILFMPESRSGKTLARMSFRRYIYRAVRFYTERGDSNPHRHVYLLCLASLFFVMLSAIQRSGIELLYLLDSPFCWSPVKIGNYEAIAHVAQKAVGLLVVTGLLRVTNEQNAYILSAIVFIASFILEAFSRTDTMMFIVAALAFPTSSLMVLQRSIMSKITDRDNQGALFASVQLIDTVCNTTGTILANMVYEMTVRRMQGAVFLYMAGLSVFSTIFMIVLCFKPPINDVSNTKRVN